MNHYQLNYVAELLN